MLEPGGLAGEVSACNQASGHSLWKKPPTTVNSFLFMCGGKKVK